MRRQAAGGAEAWAGTGVTLVSTAATSIKNMNAAGAGRESCRSPVAPCFVLCSGGRSRRGGGNRVGGRGSGWRTIGLLVD